MQYVMLIADDPTHSSSAPEAEREAIYRKIGDWFAEHGAAGRIVGGNELQGAETATTVRLRGDDVLVTDGPFLESKEVLGGYAVLECADLDEALALARSWPGRGATLEIRPVVDHSQG